MLIRPLDPSEAPLVADLFRSVADFWLMTEGVADPDRQAQAFFTDGPPLRDPASSHHLGLFLEHRLAGVAEVSYGFPEPADAYLGLMLLGPSARGTGIGRHFLAHVEDLARGRLARRLYAAVLDQNPRGRAFWLREGFADTGLSRTDPDTGHTLHRLVKAL